MSWPDYDLDDLEPSTPMGAAMHDLARRRPKRASRLVDALDDFANNSLSIATLVAPSLGNPQGKEVYLVPQQYTFSTTSDAAALVLLDHAIEKMSFLEIIEDYGPADWQRVRATAVGIVGP